MITIKIGRNACQYCLLLDFKLKHLIALQLLSALSFLIFTVQFEFERPKNVTVMKKNSRFADVNLTDSITTWTED